MSAPLKLVCWFHMRALPCRTCAAEREQALADYVKTRRRWPRV